MSCDGAARGNPGPAGIGVVVSDSQGQVLAEIGKGIGVATNNVAEYRAAVEGLRRAAELGASRALVRSDSRLLVEQASGRYRVKDAKLKPLHKELLEVAGGLGEVEFRHVPRGENEAADRLANAGVDAWLAGEGSKDSPAPDSPRLWE